jgi:hypothetical protein
VCLLASAVSASDQCAIAPTIDVAHASFGGALPDPGPSEYAAVELTAGERGAWVEFAVYSLDALQLYTVAYRVGAPYGTGFTVSSTPTLHHSDSTPVVGSVAKFGRITDVELPPAPYVSGGTGDTILAAIAPAATASHPHSWSPALWIPPGRALLFWTSVAGQEFGIAVTIAEPIQ